MNCDLCYTKLWEYSEERSLPSRGLNPKGVGGLPGAGNTFCAVVRGKCGRENRGRWGTEFLPGEGKLRQERQRPRESSETKTTVSKSKKHISGKGGECLHCTSVIIYIVSYVWAELKDRFPQMNK